MAEVTRLGFRCLCGMGGTRSSDMPREPYPIHTQTSHEPGFTADVSWLCISYGPGICPEHRLLCSVSLVRMIVCQYSDHAPAQRTENAALQLGGLPHLRVREARKRTGKDTRRNPNVCRWPPGCRFELVCGTCGGHKFHARSFSRSGNPAIVAVKAIR